MKLLMLLSLLCLFSCSKTSRIKNDNDATISLTKTECGSYAVKNKGKLVGYVVKPFIPDAENKEAHITRFENLVKTNYSRFYDKFYRIYIYNKNSAGDTTLFIEMLPIRQTRLVPNWKCEEQGLNVYEKTYQKRKNPGSFEYNCSKGRFHMKGDPW
jgi:hypothetical protein